MEPDLRELFDAVNDEPSAAFLRDLEGRLASLAGDQPDDATPVMEVSLTTPVPPNRRRIWTRFGLIAATTLAVLVAVLVVASRRESRPATEPTPTTVSTTPATGPTSSIAASTSTSAPGTTTPLTPAPFPEPQGTPSRFWEPQSPSPLARRSTPIVVAARDTVVVLGGETRAAGTPSVARRDGARWSSTTGTWQTIGELPFVPVAATWAGDRVIALGADGEAAALPLGVTGWTRLPDSGLSPRTAAVAEWTGTELVVWGGWAAPCPPEGCTPLTDGASFDPIRGVWRPLPSAGGLQPGGGAAWTGKQMVFGDGRAVRGRSDTATASWGLFDPAKRAWSTIAAPPGFSVLIAADGNRLEAVDASTGLLYTATLPSVRWQRDGHVPSDGQSSVGSAWFIDEHLVVDTGSQSTNGRFVGYREASGAWVPIGPPDMTNDEPAAVVVNGRLVGTNGSELSVLRMDEDRTIGAPPCRADEFDATVATTLLGRSVSILLYNRSDTLCAVSGQRPLDVRFSLTGRTTPIVQSASVLLHQGEDVAGGAVAPGQWARIDLTSWLGDSGTAGCPAQGEIEAIAFSLPGGDTVTVPLTGFTPPSDQCWDLSTIAAVNPTVLASRCEPAALSAGVDEAGALGNGGFVITLTNKGKTPCALVGRPTLEAQAGSGDWATVAPAGVVPNPQPPASTLEPGQVAVVRSSGGLADSAPPGTCDRTEVAATATRWRLRLAIGWAIPFEHDGLAYRCSPILSGFEQSVGTTGSTADPSTVPTVAVPPAPNPADAQCLGRAVAGEPAGAAGRVTITLTLTNDGSSPCTVDATIGVRLLDGNGQPVTSVGRRGAFGAFWDLADAPPLVVAPGATYSMRLGFEISSRDAAGNPVDCPTARGVRITLRTATAVARLPSSTTACPALIASPAVSGPDGPQPKPS